jgi:hypothetical protein
MNPLIMLAGSDWNSGVTKHRNADLGFHTIKDGQADGSNVVLWVFALVKSIEPFLYEGDRDHGCHERGYVHVDGNCCHDAQYWQGYFDHLRLVVSLTFRKGNAC